MQRLLRVMALSVAMIAMTFPQAAVAGDQDFLLHNETGVQIHQVMVSPSESDRWGEDIMGRDVLDDGESVEILFSNSEDSEFWDLKVLDPAGDSVVWEGLNLLEASEITLKFDSDGKPIAEIQ